MTQAYNLSQFANKLNSSGQASNSGLQNSSVTINAGTGMSGGGAVALGSSVTLNNTGVTSLTAGSGITLSGSTGGVTISNTFAAGTAKAWCIYNSETQTILASYNISSVTYLGTGVIKFNFTTAMSSSNYATTIGVARDSGPGYSFLGFLDQNNPQSASDVTIAMGAGAVPLDSKRVCISVFSN